MSGLLLHLLLRLLWPFDVNQVWFLLRFRFRLFLRCFVWNHLSCTLSTSCRPPLHTLRLFHRSLLVGFSYRSCLHRFSLRRCLSSRASCTTLRTRTLSLTAFGNTYMDTNRNLAQTSFPFMNSFIALSFPALTQICRYGLRYGLHHRVSFFDSVSKGGSP